MEFLSRRETAIQETKKKLREPLSADQAFVYAYKSYTTEQGIENWLSVILPEHEDPHTAIREEGKKCWKNDCIGAGMHDEHWEWLCKAIDGEDIALEEITQEIAPNLTTLCGVETAAELICAAGGLIPLSRMTQRDAQRLGNESGTFGGHDKQSILEKHELATSDRALRILASRAVLAARIDANNGEFKGDKLHQEVLYAQ